MGFSNMFLLLRGSLAMENREGGPESQNMALWPSEGKCLEKWGKKRKNRKKWKNDTKLLFGNP